MQVDLVETGLLRFADGTPVRAASAIAPYADGWLVGQDDATHACWWRRGVGTPVRVFPAVEGHEVFSEATGTKDLKPDLEAAVDIDGGVLMLGSGSTPARMRGAWLAPGGGPSVGDLSAVYARAAELLAVSPDRLNLEGACVVGDRLRWFQRGLPAAGVPTASVDVDLRALLDAVRGLGQDSLIAVQDVRHYVLESPDGLALATTDAVTLPDGRILVSAAAEDSPNTYDDGPVLGSALALLDGDVTVTTVSLPEPDGRIAKVEGLAVLEWDERGGRLLATVDADDPEVPSSVLTLDVRL
ncbi:DUF6910 family protein [Nocardioides dilutus]